MTIPRQTTATSRAGPMSPVRKTALVAGIFYLITFISIPSLFSTYNGTLLLGQTLMPCLSAILLGTVMYRSGLVPRAIPLLGLLGAPLLIASTIAAFFGIIEQISAWSAIATLPVALWELS